MQRRRSRRTKNRRNSLWPLIGGAVLVVVVLIVLALGFYTLHVTRESHVVLDPETYCPKAGPATVTAVIIDTTDSFNLVQRTDLINQIEQLIGAIPRYGALEIYAVGPIEDKQPQPVFRKCNPGRAEDISELTGNPIMVERDWRDGFREPLEDVLVKILAPSEADRSPIMESIQWVTINALTVPGRSEVSRRLVVVSDLLQNTAGVSFYHNLVDFKTFSKTPYYRRVSAPIEGIAIDLLVIQRDSRTGIQNPKFLQFWVDFFDAQGASSLRVVNLAG